MRDQDQAKITNPPTSGLVIGAAYRLHPSWVRAISGLALMGPAGRAGVHRETWRAGLRGVEDDVPAIARAIDRALRRPPQAPNSKRRKHMKGKTHVAIRRERTVDHLDPTSATHAADQAAAKAARQRTQAVKAERVNPDGLSNLKFPSLGGGLMLDAKGKELTSEEHKQLLLEVDQARAFYLGEGSRTNGKMRRRKRPTTPLHALAVLIRPDHAAGLAAVEQHPELRHLVKPFLFQVFKVVATEFSAATGLEVVAGQVHPNESVLHLHLTYASVSASNELLWPRGQRGRHGLRLLGPSHSGTLRLGAAGFLPASECSLALHDYQSRVRELGGEQPVDWRLSLVVEGLVEHFVESHGLGRLFSAAAERYRAELTARRAERPAALKAAKQKVEQERDQLAAQVAALKAQLAAIAKAAPVLAPQPAAVMPAVPTISLSRTVRTQDRT